MSTRRRGSIGFRAPYGWAEKTIVALTSPDATEGAVRANIVLTEQTMREGDSLRVHVERQLTQLGRDLDTFDLLEDSETTVGGRRAFRVRFVWLGHFAPVEQTTVYVEPSEPEEDVHVITLTASPDERGEYAREEFRRFVASVQFEDAEGDEPSPDNGSGVKASGALDARVSDFPMPGVTRRAAGEEG